MREITRFDQDNQLIQRRIAEALERIATVLEKVITVVADQIQQVLEAQKGKEEE